MTPPLEGIPAVVRNGEIGVITYDQMLNHDHEFSPNSDQLTLDSDSPLPPLDDGSYPVPQPGILKDREYAYPDETV